MMPFSSQVYRPARMRRESAASAASVLAQSWLKSSSQRSRACVQNASASSNPVPPRSVPAASVASSWARVQAALIANSSAPMSTIRPRKPCLRSSLPCQRAMP